MYISVHQSGKFRYVYICESFRKNGKNTSRIVQKLGRYDLLEAKDPDFMKKLKEQYEEQPRAFKARADEAKLNSAVSMVNEGLEKRADLDSNAAPLLCYGMEVVRAMWKNDLKLDYRLSYLQRQYSKINFDVSDAALYLTAFKLLHPASICGAYDLKHTFLLSPAQNLELHDLYRTLDFLNKHKEQIVSHLNSQIDAITQRKLSMVFYDVTNAYFETPLSDEEKKLIDEGMMKEIITIINKYLTDRGLPDLDLLSDKTFDEIEDLIELGDDEKFNPLTFFDDAGKLQVDNLPSDLYRSIKELMFLRMRGLSKEHRFDLPLISIALVIDDKGFPIDYEIYSGGSSEFTTMKQSIESIKKKYGIKDTVVVADRGLNSVDNLKMLLDNEYGFLVAQKVSNLKSDIRELMLDESSYKSLDGIPRENYRYRVVKDFEKKNRNNTVNCTLVMTFSKERQQRDLKQLEDDRRRAQEAVAAHTRINSVKRAWQQMVILKDTDGTKAESFNQELYEKRKAECGYAGMVYHKAPKDNVAELTDEQIAASYHQLVKIEECFRILKTNICLRPMFVYNQDHIRGYVLICFMALLCFRLFEYKLNQNNTPMSIRRISKALSSACVAPFKINNELLFLHTSTYDNIHSKKETKVEQKNVEDDLWLSSMEQEQSCSNALDINTLMMLCNLTPLNKLNTTASLNSCLRRKCSVDDMICKEVSDKI